MTFNEWQDDDGRIRDHYAPLAQTVEALGAGELGRRWEDAARQVSLDAFTFYLDPKRFRPTPADWPRTWFPSSPPATTSTRTPSARRICRCSDRCATPRPPHACC